jgi:hypothetical protein
MDGTETFAVTSNLVLTAVYVSAADGRWKSFQELWDRLLASGSVAPVTAASEATLTLASAAPAGGSSKSGANSERGKALYGTD